jgi:uncharacterized OB-fold protein
MMTRKPLPRSLRQPIAKCYDCGKVFYHTVEVCNKCDSSDIDVAS